MDPSKTVSMFANPFIMWASLAWKTGEMMIASAQVIGHRMGRFAAAGAAPNARDQREFALMGLEKGDAAFASSRAVWVRMMQLNQEFAAVAFRQMLAGTSAMVSLAASRTPAQAAARHTKLVGDVISNSAVVTAKASNVGAQLAQRVLQPVHSRVKGNVRRLRKG